ncbi:putative zinc finger (CCCH type) protein [Neospora caninum Liverpool]|nr:putative zinc finger (CCCH type) protein [Neospora caninum Liverpool]CBZ53075.1 putative zinc finger (CCCH type) protein [Neospora caninum Liverpool]|eukprot:XP_003883107.1 putative zinc finger (CCCH type) protein [Neospora caninum Liverpool]
MAHDVNQLDPAIKNLPPLLNEWSETNPQSPSGRSPTPCSGAIDAAGASQHPPVKTCTSPRPRQQPNYSLPSQHPHQQHLNPQELARHHFPGSVPAAPHRGLPLYPQGPSLSGPHAEGVASPHAVSSPHHSTVQRNSGLPDERLPLSQLPHSGKPAGSPRCCTSGGLSADAVHESARQLASHEERAFPCGVAGVDPVTREVTPPVRLYSFGDNSGASTPASGVSGGIRPSTRLIENYARHARAGGGERLDSASLLPPPHPSVTPSACGPHESLHGAELSVGGQARAPGAGAPFSPLPADPQDGGFPPVLDGVVREQKGTGGSLLCDSWLWPQQTAGHPLSAPRDASGVMEAAGWSAASPSSLLSGVVSAAGGAFSELSEPGTQRHQDHALLYELQRDGSSESRRGSNGEFYPGNCDPFDHLWALLDDSPGPASTEFRGTSSSLNNRMLDLHSPARSLCDSGVDAGVADVFRVGNSLSELIGTEKREAAEGFRDSRSTECSQSLNHNRANWSGAGTDAASEGESPGRFPDVGVSGAKRPDSATCSPKACAGNISSPTSVSSPLGACGRIGGGTFGLSSTASSGVGSAHSGREPFLSQARQVRSVSPSDAAPASGFSVGGEAAAAAGGEQSPPTQRAGKGSAESEGVAGLCTPVLSAGTGLWEESSRCSTGTALGRETSLRSQACCSPSNSNRSYTSNYSTSLGTSRNGGSDVANGEGIQQGVRSCFEVMGGGIQGAPGLWTLAARAGTETSSDPAGSSDEHVDEADAAHLAEFFLNAPLM